MTKNTYKIDATGNLSAVVYVKASSPYRCKCGKEFSVDIDWPEGLEQKGAISVKGVSCPVCSTPVVLPRALYRVEDYVLRSEPISE